MTFQGTPICKNRKKKTFSGIVCLWPTVSISHELAADFLVAVWVSSKRQGKYLQ